MSRVVAMFWLSCLSCLALLAHVGCPEPIEETPPAVRTQTAGLWPHLVLHRKGRGGVEKLRTGEQVDAGDLIQVSYVAAGHERGVIVSVDGSGRVTLHHPAQPDDPPRLQPRGETPLPYSFELDAAPDYERFFFVVGDNEGPSPRQIVAAAERLASQGADARRAPLPLSARWRQTSITLEKP